MTKADIVEKVSARLGLQKNQSADLVDHVIELMKSSPGKRGKDKDSRIRQFRC